MSQNCGFAYLLYWVILTTSGADNVSPLFFVLYDYKTEE